MLHRYADAPDDLLEARVRMQTTKRRFGVQEGEIRLALLDRLVEMFEDAFAHAEAGIDQGQVPGRAQHGAVDGPGHVRAARHHLGDAEIEQLDRGLLHPCLVRHAPGRRGRRRAGPMRDQDVRRFSSLDEESPGDVPR